VALAGEVVMHDEAMLKAAVQAPDQGELEAARHMLAEACERANSAHTDAERWGRIARSHAARIRELEQPRPTPRLDPQELIEMAGQGAGPLPFDHPVPERDIRI
jgi:thiamine pyrophosphate-dependent acetolactate synthase large subunit-like protein